MEPATIRQSTIVYATPNQIHVGLLVAMRNNKRNYRLTFKLTGIVQKDKLIIHLFIPILIMACL